MSEKVYVNGQLVDNMQRVMKAAAAADAAVVFPSDPNAKRPQAEIDALKHGGPNKSKAAFAEVANGFHSGGAGTTVVSADEVRTLYGSFKGYYQDQINEKLKADISGATGSLAGYQKKLTAGNGIKIDEATNTISTTLDLTLFKLVTTLPDVKTADASKIYLVQDAAGNASDQNVYIEYIVVSTDGTANGRKWEKLGQYKSNVDLSGYLTKADAENTYSKKADVYTKAETDTKLGSKVNTSDVMKAADATPTTSAEQQKKVVSYEKLVASYSNLIEKKNIIYNNPTTPETGDDAKLPTVAKVNSLISSRVGTVYRPKGSVADKAALFALTGVKAGDVYNVVAAVTVGGDNYPKATNFVALVDHDATTDANFAANWDSLGGMFDQSYIDRMWKIIIYNHAYASIKVNSGLTNGIIEKGVSTTVNIGWGYGINGDSAKPNSVKIQKAGADWTDGLAAASKDDTLTDSSNYKIIADFGSGITKEQTVYVTARYPVYIVCSAKTSLVSTDILAADGDNHKKYLMNNPGSGTQVSVNNSADGQYIWVCVPADMKVTDMKMGGQPMTYMQEIGVAVDGKGTYRAYRSGLSQSAGQKTFNIWGQNTTDTPPTPQNKVYTVEASAVQTDTTKAPVISLAVKDSAGTALDELPTNMYAKVSYNKYTIASGVVTKTETGSAEDTFAAGDNINSRLNFGSFTSGQAIEITKVEVSALNTTDSSYSGKIASAHGDVKFVRVNKLPEGSNPMKLYLMDTSESPAGDVTCTLTGSSTGNLDNPQIVKTGTAIFSAGAAPGSSTIVVVDTAYKDVLGTVTAATSKSAKDVIFLDMKQLG